MNSVFTGKINFELTTVDSKIEEVVTEIQEVNSKIAVLEERDHLSERCGLYTYSIGNVVGLVYATRIGAPALNAILPPMCTNYREQSHLDYLRKKESQLREEKNIKLREKEYLRNQLMIGEQRRLKREQLDTSGN